MKITKMTSRYLIAAIIAAIQFVPLFQMESKAVLTNFITTSGGKFYDGLQELRWCSVNIPFVDMTEDGEGGTWKELNQWEQEDLIKTVVQMNGKVIRRYALSTKQPNKTYAAHVQGPGQFSEQAFVAFDRFLALCNQYNVRIIVPFVDQYDYNWNGGIKSYEAFRGVALDDGYNFVTNMQIRADFKATINYVLNRTNTVTGIKYKDDKAILAWETGNELWCENKNYAWVTDIAAYVKSIDSNHLLIDGDMEPSVAGRPCMTDPNIDIVSNHYYKWSNGHTDLTASLIADAAITRGIKPLIVGEHGLTNATDIHNMLDAVTVQGVSGCMLWSLRGHREAGGFWQHEEGSWTGDGVDYWAYHWPGFPINDNYGETTVIQDVYQHAFSINGQIAPAIPIPAAPVLLSISNPTVAINWKGSVGGKNYDIQRSVDNSSWTTIATNVYDIYKNYSYPANYSDASATSSGYYYRIIAKNTSGSSSPSNVVIWGTPPVVVPVTSVSVSPTTASIYIGYTQQLTVTVLPSNATTKTVNWSSSNSSIASVNSSGLVTGVATGTATITVTTVDGNKTATCAFTVTPVAVTGVSLSPTTGSLIVGGGTIQLTATVSPSNATNKNVIWSSSNTSVATVNSSGLVSSVAVGTAIITVTTQNGSKTATSAISVSATVPAPWTTGDIGAVAATGSASYSGSTFTLNGSGYDIEENVDEFRFVHQPKSGDVTVTARVVSITNTNAWAKAGVMIRESLNDNSAMVFMPVTYSNGTFFQMRTSTGGISQETTVVAGIATPYWVRVTRVGNTYTGYTSSDGTTWTQLGSTTFTMTTTAYIGLAVTSHNDGTLCTAVFDNVTVSGTTTVPVTSVSVSPTSATIIAGVTQQLTATVLPSNATNKTVSWASNNTSIATVNSSGLVTGVAAGSATITVTTLDGSKTATSSINVTATTVPVTSVSVSPTSTTIVAGGTQQLSTTVLPSNATNKTISWTSSNTLVATVNSSGLVTGIAAGSATITVTTQDGNKTATSAITVTSNPAPVVIDKFEGYSGLNVNLQTAYVCNSSGNNFTVTLNDTYKFEGSYGMQCAYTIGTPDYAGVISSISQNWNGRNNLSFWLKPDGSNRTLTIQFKEASGEYWESYYTFSGTTVTTIQIPFSGFVHPSWFSGGNGIKDLGSITEFSIYINQGSGSTGSSTIYFDNIRAIYVVGSQTAKVTTSLSSLENNELIVTTYPNPATEAINLKFVQEGEYSLTLMDITGRLLEISKISGNSAEMNIARYPNGFYFIRIDGNNLSKVTKIIKK